MRLFIGALAERHRVIMGGNDWTEMVVRRAIQRRHDMCLDLSCAVCTRCAWEDLSGYARWQQQYRAAGLWHDWSDEDALPALLDANLDEKVMSEWEALPAKYWGVWQAETVVMCGLDAWLSNRIYVISDADWQALMTTTLKLTQPPALCRREAIVDWLTGEAGAWQDTDRVLDIMLAVTRPADDLRTPLQAWAGSTRSFLICLVLCWATWRPCRSRRCSGAMLRDGKPSGIL